MAASKASKKATRPAPRSAAKKATPTRAAAAAPKRPAKSKTGVVLLSGGNPQIAKADGNAPVKAYLDALPGWKRAAGKRLDALIVRAVPGVQKAVRWNSPMYGVEGQGYFAALHALTHYLRVTYFFGQKLAPLPPGPSKDPHARYFDLREGDTLDEAQFVAWAAQAAAVPGWDPGAAQRKAATKPAKAAPRASRAPAPDESATAASAQIDQRIRDLDDWRGEMLARVRALIRAAAPAVVEEMKWRGTPVWSHDGIVCTGETYAKVVKLTFAHGARLDDPKRLFNASLEGGTRRAIDLREGDKLDAAAFKALIKAALADNAARVRDRKKR